MRGTTRWLLVPLGAPLLTSIANGFSTPRKPCLPHRPLSSTMGSVEDLPSENARHLADSREAFVAWAVQNAVPIHCIEPFRSDDGDHPDQQDPFLSHLGAAVAQFSVVLLSEGFHNCREMMTLHHRIIQHLCTSCGFGIVGSESGLPESRDVADYVTASETKYSEMEKEQLWSSGLNKMYSAWSEGRDLIEWMREHNLQLGTEAQTTSARETIGYCGLDIGGFYTDWSYPVSKIHSYLRDQLPEFEAEWSKKIEPLLGIMGRSKARYNYQHLLSPAQKATLAVLLDDLVLELKSREEELAGDLEFEWARQSAISMQLAENYYRNYENMSLSDAGAGISKYTGLDGREIAMANNMMWRLNLDNRRDRKMVIINHVIHTKTATQYQDGVWGHFVPMGQQMKQMLDKDSEALFSVGMVYGGGTFWNKWQKCQERFVDTTPLPKDDGLEVVMKQISREANLPNFFLHWEKAPKEAWLFLNEVSTIRENDYFIKAYPLEWNACVYLDKVSHATPA